MFQAESDWVTGVGIEIWGLFFIKGLKVKMG
jgi:hypothetical protein